MSKKLLLTLQLLIIVILAQLAIAEDAKIPTSQPVQKIVINPFYASLLSGPNLMLSDGEDSASQKFSFVYEISTIHEKRELVKTFDCIVSRDGNRTAILMRYADGLPIFYISNEFYVRFDSVNKQLRLCHNAKPEFVLTRVDNKIDGRVYAKIQRPSDGIHFDPLSLIGVTTDRTFLFDAASMSMTTDSFDDQVVLEYLANRKASEYPIQSLTVRQHKTGFSVRVHRIIVDSDPVLNIVSLTEKGITESGLQPVILTDADLKHEKIMPENNTITDEAERKFAIDCLKLFPIRNMSEILQGKK